MEQAPRLTIRIKITENQGKDYRVLILDPSPPRRNERQYSILSKELPRGGPWHGSCGRRLSERRTYHAVLRADLPGRRADRRGARLFRHRGGRIPDFLDSVSDRRRDPDRPPGHWPGGSRSLSPTTEYSTLTASSDLAAGSWSDPLSGRSECNPPLVLIASAA